MAEADLSLAARRVEAGDRAQFRVIVEHTQRDLFRLAARVTGSLTEAEDVLQEAYLKAFRALSDGQFDRRAGLKTWLYRVVTNTAIDSLRRKAVRPAGSDDKLESTVARTDDPEAHMALRELSDWLGELPPDQRAAVVLKSVEGLTTPEVAKILECSEGAVEQRLVRARATLRRRRDDHDDT